MWGAVGGGRRRGRHPRGDRLLAVRDRVGVGRRTRLAFPPGSRHGGEDGPAAPPPRPALLAAAAVLTADVDLGTATVIAAEYGKLAPDLREDAQPVVLEQFLSVGAECGPAGVRRLRQEILARYGENHRNSEGPPGDMPPPHRPVPRGGNLRGRVGLPAHHRQRRPRRPRSRDRTAVRNLHPDPATGDRDLRPVGRRRGQALTDALRPYFVTSPPAACAHLTQGRADPHDGLPRPRRPGGSSPTSPEPAPPARSSAPDTIRKIACDAAVIPTVLGGQREVLDHGRERRLFTTAQIRALWLRDTHCTFPHCDAPATWCDAHHITPWIDGGATDLRNAALLCPHHHTIVHRDHLTATLTPHGLSWDQRPNSYQPTRR